MPKDEWAKARAKDAARRGQVDSFLHRDHRLQRAARRARRLEELVKLVPGTNVMVRKHGEDRWRAHRVRKAIKARVSRRWGNTLYLQFSGWEIMSTVV